MVLVLLLPNAVLASHSGLTPLHEACNFGWFKVAKMLIESGADVCAPSLNGQTPLHNAVICGKSEVSLWPYYLCCFAP